MNEEKINKLYQAMQDIEKEFGELAVLGVWAMLRKNDMQKAIELLDLYIVEQEQEEIK